MNASFLTMRSIAEAPFEWMKKLRMLCKKIVNGEIDHAALFFDISEGEFNLGVARRGEGVFFHGRDITGA